MKKGIVASLVMSVAVGVILAPLGLVADHDVLWHMGAVFATGFGLTLGSFILVGIGLFLLNWMNKE